MRFLVGMLLAAAVTGCHTHAIVQSLHADRCLVEGATAVPWHWEDDALKERKAVSKIVAGDRVVLLSEDSGSRPGWYDSGNAEVLIVEVPALKRAASWAIGPEGAHVWMWRGSARANARLEGAAGTISTEIAEGREWTLRVDFRGQMVFAYHTSETEPVELHHGFTLSPMTFQEFDKREAFIWTRR